MSFVSSRSIFIPYDIILFISIHSFGRCIVCVDGLARGEIEYSESCAVSPCITFTPCLAWNKMGSSIVEVVFFLQSSWSTFLFHHHLPFFKFKTQSIQAYSSAFHTLPFFYSINSTTIPSFLCTTYHDAFPSAQDKLLGVHCGRDGPWKLARKEYSTE